ncbi:hypothetical protein PTKIN_Ptkin19aG0011100 [Pterospermum kingtungense]
MATPQNASSEEELMIQTLPQEKSWDGSILYLYQGFWYPYVPAKAVISFQNHFKAHQTDIFLITVPKSGTTWLKALIFSIVNCNQFPLSQSPLLSTSPHELVPIIEFDIYSKNQNPDLENGNFPSPRNFTTHTPYGTLPNSILESNCRIVYLCRNPLDQFISDWHFVRNPCLWSILGLKYEDLKEDITSNLKKLADFLDYPFSDEEIRQGVVEEISKHCSFETLKNLEVNKTGKRHVGIKNSTFFKNGKVGDWANFITPAMVNRIKQGFEEKLSDSGLNFDWFDKKV